MAGQLSFPVLRVRCRDVASSFSGTTTAEDFSTCSYSDSRIPARTGQILPSLSICSVSTSIDWRIERGPAWSRIAFANDVRGQRYRTAIGKREKM